MSQSNSRPAEVTTTYCENSPSATSTSGAESTSTWNKSATTPRTSPKGPSGSFWAASEHFLDAGVQAFEPLVQLGEHVDPLAGPRELAFELAVLLVDADEFAAERGEPRFADAQLGLAGVEL